MERIAHPTSTFLYPKLLIAFLLFTAFSFAQGEKINQFDANGKRHGLWKGVYEKTQRPRYEGVFQHGKETGIFNYFDDTKAGKIIATRDFSKADGSCYATFYDREGNVVSRGMLNSNREHQGEWVTFHKASEQPMTVENYKNGKLHGLQKVFYKDGKIASETHYVDGIKEGIFKQYAENGVVLEEIPYKNNQFHGWVIYRDSNGNFIAQGRYEKGLKKGIWKFYEDGKLVKEVDSESKEYIYRGQ